MSSKILKKRPNISNSTWNAARKQATLKLKGRPIVLYANNKIDTQAVTEFNHKLENPDPKNPVIEGHELPEVDYQLKYVFGYRGHDNKNNLVRLKSGEVAYFTAAVVVIIDPFRKNCQIRQKIFNKHTDDITCLAVHPDGVILASGQHVGIESRSSTNLKVKRPAHILIWDSSNLQVLRVPSGF